MGLLLHMEMLVAVEIIAEIETGMSIEVAETENSGGKLRRVVKLSRIQWVPSVRE